MHSENSSLSLEGLQRLLVEMVATPSPTGREGVLATSVAERLAAAGVEADVVLSPEGGGSVIASVGAGSTDHPILLLYAPIDTHLATTPASDVPWFGSKAELDLWAQPRVRDHTVAGIGAENPKGYAAAVVDALLKLRTKEIPGTVRAVLCGSAMPTMGHPEHPGTMGLGSGVLSLLQRGVVGDFAIACKPGWTVAHEEVGLLWLRVRVHGSNAYVGFRHKGTYDNPLRGASQLFLELDRWFVDYAAAEQSGLTEPQGAVSALQTGLVSQPAFVSQACDLVVDVRTSPRRSLSEAARIVIEKIHSLAAGLDAKVTVSTIASVPASTTAEDSWIIRCCREVWEAMEGRPHEHILRTSGASDTSLLRRWGIPTARVGLPLGVEQDHSWCGPDPLGMNVVDTRDVRRLSEFLADAATRTCTRRISELASPSTNGDGHAN